MRGRTPDYLYKNCVLCANHFEDSQFMHVPSKNKLVPEAVPTLFDVPNPPPRVSLKRQLPTPRSDPSVTRARFPATAVPVMVRQCECVCSNKNLVMTLVQSKTRRAISL